MADAGFGRADAAEERPEVVALVVAVIGATQAALDAILSGLARPQDVMLLLLPRVGEALAPPALRAEDGMRMQGGRVVVIPEGSEMRIRDGRLRIAAVPDPAMTPLDALLASLAEAAGSRAIAVLLADAEAGASRGLAALRRADGWVMAEEAVAEAEVDQRMPRLAIGPALSAWAAATRRSLGQEMLQAIQQPVALLDSRRQVLGANAAFHSAFGHAPERLEAALRSAPRLDALLAAPAAVQGGSEESIVELPLADGETRLLRVSASRVPGSLAAEGSARGEGTGRTLLSIEDLTEQTRLAGRLELAKAVAERADREKSRFLAAASHDLRQPLQSMSMLHGLLAAKATDAGMLRLIGRLDETIDAMSGILDALLDINRMEVGRVHAEIAPVPIGALLASLEREFGDSARAAGLAWRMVPSDAVVLSDARLLRQVLRNLLSNALKYTRQGRILLGCRRAGGRLRVEVWDTGIGIPQAQMQAVFEEFHQIGKTARARSQGLGLGLAIARRLAKLLGHPIGVRSRENVGSCFHLDLPLAHGGIEAEEPAQATPPAAASILVIEDDPTVGDAVRMLLQQAGYAAMLALDGSKAIAMAADEPPALIITDYNLPGPFNGVELTLQLRQVLVPPPAAIILTGDTSERTRQEIGLLDVEHAPKPIRADELLARVRRLLPVPARPPAPPPAPALQPSRTAATQAEAASVQAHAQEDAAQAAKAQTGGNVFIVDDDAMLRRDVGEWLVSNGWSVQSFPSAEAFLQADEPGRQGCVLVDAVMPGMDGLALLAALRPHAQRMPAIMVTGHGDVRMAVRAMTAGAIDFIEKPIGRADLLRSIAAANARIANAMSEATERAEMAGRLRRLTPRQREILDRVVAGSPSKIIAAELLLNQRTVENHRAAIMAKLGVRSLPELIRKVVSASGPGG
ncbi:response regulator [Falsiroseomonas tokyonensis]|uniref:histidine kinase n=1 Tax=Falsiroseomonas tokyonensis TaxID=430521 RepID=A0ABV7BNT9_9PROT|nr:response regulator [Falsiroseomonas tokyonensis]MBU8536747.1 response regulator [Falsiroseomonas tokyonensis]